MMSGSAMKTNGQPYRSGAPPAAAVGMVADEVTRSLLAQSAAARGIPCSFEIGSIADAIAILAREDPVDCLIVEITDVWGELDDVAILSSHLPQQTKLIVLGDFSSADQIELKAAGAALCIEKKALAEELNSIFGTSIGHAEGAQDSLAAPAANPTTNVIATIGLPAIAAVPVRAAASEPVHQPPVALPGLPTASPTVRPTVDTAQDWSESASARDFSGPPNGRSDWQDLPHSDKEPPSVPARRKGRVIVLVGCRGGVGTTSIAVSLAWLLSEETALSTILLDLDAHFGSVALALNLDPGEGLQQALERPNRVDSLFVDRAVRKVGKKLYVLSSERALDSPLHSDPTAAASLIKTLSQRHDRVVVDLPRQDPEAMKRVLSLADEIVLVTDLSLAGARDAVRLMALVRKATSYARVRLIGGGGRDNGKNSALTPSEFRKASGIAFEIAMAHDPDAANEAARTGKPIAKVAPRSAVSKTLRNLAQSLEPPEQRERKRRLLFWK